MGIIKLRHILWRNIMVIIEMTLPMLAENGYERHMLMSE